jgi:hypothetical protein
MQSAGFLPATRQARRNRQEGEMAHKTIFVSDLSGKAIADGKAARITVNFQDARKGTYVLDVTEEEREEAGAARSRPALRALRLFALRSGFRMAWRRRHRVSKQLRCDMGARGGRRDA